MKITYLGHAAILMQGSKSIIIDPFLTNNPLASLKPAQLPHIDFVLITYDHFDHIGDALLSIGGHYVVDVKQASMATQLLQPKIMVPIHYNTWPISKVDPNELISLSKGKNIKILFPGGKMLL